MTVLLQVLCPGETMNMLHQNQLTSSASWASWSYRGMEQRTRAWARPLMRACTWGWRPNTSPQDWKRSQVSSRVNLACVCWLHTIPLDPPSTKEIWRQRDPENKEECFRDHSASYLKDAETLEWELRISILMGTKIRSCATSLLPIVLHFLSASLFPWCSFYRTNATS